MCRCLSLDGICLWWFSPAGESRTLAKMFKLNKSWKSGFFLEKLSLALAGAAIERILPKDLKKVRRELARIST